MASKKKYCREYVLFSTHKRDAEIAILLSTPRVRGVIPTLREGSGTRQLALEANLEREYKVQQLVLPSSLGRGFL